VTGSLIQTYLSFDSLLGKGKGSVCLWLGREIHTAVIIEMGTFASLTNQL
jgi:hypothetical protein